MKKIRKMRLDELLVEQNHCESRSKAKALILAGQVWKETERLDKASQSLPTDTKLQVKAPLKYVGRGGLKMENFLKETQINPSGLPILDLGASTGGFTDCLLQMGAKQATCVDVGHGQLHYKLRTDPRVQNFEKMNLRHLNQDDLEGAPFPLVVMDLSFISLQKVLPQAWNFVAKSGILISLVKPQFECTRAEATESKGVIRSPETQQRVKDEILAFSLEKLPGCSLLYDLEATPRGTDGNLEFFLAWENK